jgi:hypothetical protein
VYPTVRVSEVQHLPRSGPYHTHAGSTIVFTQFVTKRVSKKAGIELPLSQSHIMLMPRLQVTAATTFTAWICASPTQQQGQRSR